MKIIPLFATLAAGSLLAFAAPGVQAQSATPAAAKKETAKMDKAASGGFTAADKKLIKTAAESDETEISMAKMALQKSENPEIKKYAQMMVDDHGKTTMELKPIADAAGVPKPEIKPKHKAVAAKLETLSGSKFDMAYMEANVKSHREAAEKMKKQSALVTNPDLKAFATATLPVVEHHAMMAQEMETKMGGSAGATKKTM